MSEKLAKLDDVKPGRQVVVPVPISEDEMAVIREMIAPTLTPSELELFFHECARIGTHPLDRSLIPIKFEGEGKAKLTFITTIDLYRSIAEDTGLYRGQGPVAYGPLSIQLPPADKFSPSKSAPEWATAEVRRLDPDTGSVFTVAATAFWDEYYPGDGLRGGMWRKLPRGMLGKCAEALALRKAFPKKLAQLYTNDEMDQAGPSRGPATPPPSKTDQVKAATGQTPGAATPPATNGGDKVSVKQAIGRILYDLTGGDMVKSKALLKEVSYFKGTDDKVHEVELVSQLKEGGKWSLNILADLEKKVKAKAAQAPAQAPAPADDDFVPEVEHYNGRVDPQGCPKKATACDAFSIRGNDGWCGMDGTVCRYV